MPKLEKSSSKLDAAQSGNAGTARMLKEEVDEEDIAKIVSKWTGIPVSRMLEGEVKNSSTWRSGCASASSARMRH
jgi:ATP-dependent Clp protease ATP-binding subunit ClpB